MDPTETKRSWTLHLRFRVSAASQERLIDFLREAIPYYEEPSGIRIRLLRSRQEPGRFIEVVEYENQEIHDRDQLRVKTDAHMKELLMRWHALLASPLEVETYEEVTDLLSPQRR